MSFVSITGFQKVENNRRIASKSKVSCEVAKGRRQLGTYSELSEVGEIGGEGVSSKNEISPRSTALPVTGRVGVRGLGL